MRIKTSGVTIDKKLFFFASQELRYGLVDKCELNCATAVPYKILPEKFSMSRGLIAFRAFFAVLFHGDTAALVQATLSEKYRLVLRDDVVVAADSPLAEIKLSETPLSKQNEALTLLATLQREARLIDFLKEDLRDYSDEQVGGAVRAIHRDSAKVIDRVFALRPLVAEEDGAQIHVPTDFDAARYRLTGNVSGRPPYRGKLQHHGWEATRCDLPQFIGSPLAAKTVAPAEVEIA